MKDEEINDILFTLESDDEGAEDILENVTDEDSDSDYEPIAEDLVDDDELIENIYREEQLRNVKSEKRKPGKKSKIGGSRSKPTHLRPCLWIGDRKSGLSHFSWKKWLCVVDTTNQFIKRAK